MTVVAAADGSSLGNPGPAGWAWFVDEGCWQAGGWPEGTNNQGELTAVLELLKSTAHLDDSLQILCDSRYVIDSLTKWLPGWKRKGWRKADGSAVLNKELMQALDAAMQGREVSFEWVKGHAGHPLNERADDLARAAATAYAKGRLPEHGPGYSGSTHPVSASQNDDARAERSSELPSDLATQLAAAEQRIAELAAENLELRKMLKAKSAGSSDPEMLF